ncbi:MAG: hypothetical protein WB853_05390 [Desulfobacterales bacterium]|jgi:hypothetical protein
MKIGIGSGNIADARASGRLVAEGALNSGSIDKNQRYYINNLK